jgi:hypothetical protein
MAGGFLPGENHPAPKTLQTKDLPEKRAMAAFSRPAICGMSPMPGSKMKQKSETKRSMFTQGGQVLSTAEETANGTDASVKP